MRKWLIKVNLLSFQLENFFKFVISAPTAKHLDVTTTFTYPHANMPLSQSEHTYHLSYFTK